MQEIALLKDVRALQIIPGELVKPFKSSFPSRLAQSRTEVLQKLLEELGIENSGFTLENVMTVKDQNYDSKSFSLLINLKLFPQTLGFLILSLDVRINM